ncbi:MAG: cytochrome c [Alphaproteobacteria bacterium]
MRRNLILAISIGAIALAAALIFFVFRSEQVGSVHSGANLRDPAVVALGQEVYANNCASCHGENLEGQPDWRRRQPDGRLPAPPHDDTGHTWHHLDVDLFRITKNGVQDIVGPDYKTDMPVFKEILTDDEIWAAIAFIKSKWSERIRLRQRQIESRQE